MADRTYEALSNNHGKARDDVVNDVQKSVLLGCIGQPDILQVLSGDLDHSTSI